MNGENWRPSISAKLCRHHIIPPENSFSPRKRIVIPKPLFVVLAGSAIALTSCTSDQVVGRYTIANCIGIKEPSAACRTIVPEADVTVITIATPGGTSVAPSASPPTPSAPISPTAAAPPAAPSGSAPSSATNGLGLPERALATYIDKLADPRVAKVADALRQNLAAPFKSDGPAAVDDRTIFHRTMIVSVARDPLLFNPADRLEAVDIQIQPENAVIQSWDSAATVYSTINAGTVQFTGTQTGTGSATLGLPTSAPLGGSLTGGFTRSDARVENFTATQQAESLTISLANNDTYALDRTDGLRNELRIHRQGGIGVDLTGNVILKTDIVLPADVRQSVPPLPISRRWVFSVKGDYFDKNGNKAEPSSLTLIPQLALVAKNTNATSKPVPITASVVLTYTLRHIVSGDETLEEKDDKIEERTFQTAPKTVVLVSGSETSPRAYSILSADQSLMMVQRREAAGSQVLCFASYDAANDFVTYLQHAGDGSPAKIGTARLGFTTLASDNLRPLRKADVAGLVAYGSCPD